MAEIKKQAVVLFNLGGPDAVENIKPFLFNFFMDKNIISMPKPFRYLLAKYISIKRSKGEALEAYNELGGKSPLLENTLKQQDALQKELEQKYPDKNIKVFTSMRYWHPMANEVIGEVKKFNPDEIILLPLYPQYSTTTTKSSFENWDKNWSNCSIKTTKICCYPTGYGFVKASADLIKTQIKDIKQKYPDQKFRILFSAHGLPEKIIKAGDPYQHQCEKTVEAIINDLGINNIDYRICYQSQVGRLKWIGPNIKEEIKNAANDKIGLLVYPHAFVSEHVETLVEIDKEYRQMALNLKIPFFEKVKTVGTHPIFIKGLADLILQALNNKIEKTCPANCIKCGKDL